MNLLMKELHSRDVDFKNNKNGFDYTGKRSPGYFSHKWYYEQVQALLGRVQGVYEEKCNNLSFQSDSILYYWESKDPEPLGHPGHPQHKSLLDRAIDMEKSAVITGLNIAADLSGIPVPNDNSAHPYDPDYSK